jgi:rubrerythrin
MYNTMANAWIEHVKQYAAKKGISYKEAMKLARASYHAPAKKTAVKKTAAKKRAVKREIAIKVVCPECHRSFPTDFPYESSPPQAKCPSCGAFVTATKSQLDKLVPPVSLLPLPRPDRKRAA